MRTFRILISVYLICLFLSALIYYVGLYRPEPPYADEIYFPFVFVSGPVVWFLSLLISAHIIGLLSRFHGEIPGHIAIVVIPGLLNAVMGVIQLKLLLRIYRQFCTGRRNTGA